MAPWQRNASIKLSNAWDARCVTNCASGTMRRSAVWRNNVTDLTVTTACATSTIATTTCDRIATTVVVVITTTSAKRNGRTGPLLIAATRRSNRAFVHGPQRKHTSNECYKNPKNYKHQVQDKNVNMRRITTTRATQVTTMSCALAPMHRFQVRTWRQPCESKKNPRGWELSSSYW